MKLLKLLFAFSFCIFSAQALSHPHSFLDIKNKVIVEGTKLKAFQMEWMLDEISSADLIYDIKNSVDQAQTVKEITDEMVQTAVGNHYFSYLYDKHDKPIKFTTSPTDTRFEIKGTRVIFYITFYISKPYELKDSFARLYSYEPTYYMGIEYNSEKDLSISNSQCTATLTQPQVDNQLRLYASSLDKNQTPEMAGNEDYSLGAQFAQKVTIKCE